jgi:hypothetical protein
MKISDVFGIKEPAIKAFKPLVDYKLSNPSLIIGLELETENCTLGADDYTRMLTPAHFQVTQDGSLRGNAYEFISKPMRSDNAVNALAHFFNVTKFNEANYSDRCSVHVHANCTNLEKENVAALAVLYTVFEEIMFSFVGGNRDSNIYCIPWSQCRSHLDLVQRFINDSSSTLRRWNKYTALNLIPLAKQGTVEFRQMHGTADMSKLVTWIDIIGSLFKNAAAYQLNDLIGEIKALNSNSQYEMFFNKILSGSLPYNEQYQQKMEEGVIFAKYSLVSMSKKPAVKMKVDRITEDDLLADIRNPAAEMDMRLNVPQRFLWGGGTAGVGNAVRVNPFDIDTVGVNVAPAPRRPRGPQPVVRAGHVDEALGQAQERLAMRMQEQVAAQVEVARERREDAIREQARAIMRDAHVELNRNNEEGNF